MPVHLTRLARYETNAVGDKTGRAYVPVPLPPVPKMDLGGLQIALGLVNQMGGRLDGITSVLPNPLGRICDYMSQTKPLESRSTAPVKSRTTTQCAIRYGTDGVCDRLSGSA